jgi:hypothetical protein
LFANGIPNIPHEIKLLRIRIIGEERKLSRFPFLHVNRGNIHLVKVREKRSTTSAETTIRELFDRVDATAFRTNEDLIQSFQETIVNLANYYSLAPDDQACKALAHSLGNAVILCQTRGTNMINSLLHSG